MALRCGKYVLGERLATGGMAEIYQANARGEFGFSRRVVVKRLLPHLASRPEVVQLFLDEARLLARLHHPRVVQVLDLGSAEGQSYQALEHLDGADLQALLARPLPAELGLRIGAAVAEALAYVHAARGDDGEPLQIVHGDVAPGNVMVTRAGEVKLVDFGVARWAGHRNAPRGGTPGFIAPEVLDGGEPTRSSDLFGLGKLLERVCAGPNVPALAHALIEALTAPEPSQRPRSADEALAVLNTCLRELGPQRPLAQVVRPLLPEKKRARPELIAATMLLTAPVLAFDAAIALGTTVAHAPVQLARYARRTSPLRMVAMILGALLLGAGGFGAGLWAGWQAPTHLAQALERALGHVEHSPEPEQARATDLPSPPLRRSPPPLRRRSRQRAATRNDR